MNTPDRVFFGFLVAGMLTLGAGLVAWARPVELSFSREDIQRQVDAKLPIEADKGPFHVRVTSAEVQLRADTRLGVVAGFHADAAGRTADGQATLSGVLVYEPGEGAFYLRQAALETVKAEIGRVSPDDAASTGRVRQAVRSLGQAVLEYTGLDDNLAALRSASVEAFQERATHATSEVLARVLDGHPVYRLDQGRVRHRAARLVLQRIDVTGDAMVVTLDLRDAAWRVIGWVVVALGAVALITYIAALLSNDDRLDGRTSRTGFASGAWFPDDCCLAAAVFDATPDTGCCLAEAASAFEVPDCFVATASLQAEDRPAHPDLVALRALRDQVLARSAPGRLFSRLYYRWGRYPAAMIRGRPLPCWVVRTLLVQPMARLARHIL